MILVSKKKAVKICSIVGIVLFFVYTFGFFNFIKKNEDNYKFGVRVRLQNDQDEYRDSNGIPVIVGHYAGNFKADPGSYKLTDELKNLNMFDPKPNEGKNGLPVIIHPTEMEKMKALFTINRFNLLASDRIPLNRSLPDYRRKTCIFEYKNLPKLPTTSVIIIFHNEAWSTLLRTVHSVINRSPRELLTEIILVDDGSTREFLKRDLDEHVANLPVPVWVLRTGIREGLIRARLLGAKAARGDVLTFLDSHCECTKGWLEPLLFHIYENRKIAVSPVIDIIQDTNFAYVKGLEFNSGGFSWGLHFRWYLLDETWIRKLSLKATTPFPTPVMAGGLFAIEKEYFFEIGAYDDKMQIWGGENLELSFRIWQCGGSVKIVPCSHVGHVFRGTSPLDSEHHLSKMVYGNLARVAMVWMDDWQNFVFKFHAPMEIERKKQNVKARLRLRSQLKCKSFRWYLDNVWPDHFFPRIGRFFGRIKNSHLSQCIRTEINLGSKVDLTLLGTCDRSLQNMFVETDEKQLVTDENRCLAAAANTVKAKVKKTFCRNLDKLKWSYNETNRKLVHLKTGFCLDVFNNSLVLMNCNADKTQEWILDEVSWK